MRFFILALLLLFPQLAFAQWQNYQPVPQLAPLPQQQILMPNYGTPPTPRYNPPSYPPQTFGSPSYVSPYIRQGGTYVQGYQRGYRDGYDFNNDDD